MLSLQEMISLQRLNRRTLNRYSLVKIRGIILLPVEITQAVHYLSKKYPVATVLLYGSYAVNLHTTNSDMDLIVFTNINKATHETAEFNLHLLDAWVYDKDSINSIDNYLHIYPFITLRDDFLIARELEKRIVEHRRLIAVKPTDYEKTQLRLWLNKMLQRAREDDIIGQYRYNTLLNDFPELYCRFKGLYYDGPIKTIRIMQENDPSLFDIYSQLLLTPKNCQLLSSLYAKLST